MTTDPTEVIHEIVRVPAGTLSISMVPAFEGGYIIRFTGTGGSFLGPAITAPVSVTFNPDGTLTYPLPFTADVA